MPMIRLRRWYVPGGLVILTVTTICSPSLQKMACADQNVSDKPDEQKWLGDRSLNLTPRPVPVPALKYRLFPIAVEMREGNAVPIYLRLAHEQSDSNRRLWREGPAEWNKLPLDQIPIDEARKLFQKFAYNIRRLELGARRKT